MAPPSPIEGVAVRYARLGITLRPANMDRVNVNGWAEIGPLHSDRRPVPSLENERRGEVTEMEFNMQTTSTNTAVATTGNNGLVFTDLTRTSRKIGELVVVGQRCAFGKGIISEWRKTLRAAGKTANEASKVINDALASGEGNLRWAQFQVFVEVERSKGHIPNIAETRDNTAVARFAAPPKVSTKAAKAITKEAILATLSGMSAAEKAAILEFLK
jgi:hypothetical protein